MDYNQFFIDVTKWVAACNDKVRELGFYSSEFWIWVSLTLAKLCEKYNNDELAQKQAIMLWEWLEEKVNQSNDKEIEAV